MPSKELMLSVARMAFIEGKNNTQIARILEPEKVITENTNLTWVRELKEQTGQWLIREHELLADLERQGIREQQLARELMEKFNLLDVRVVPGGDIHEPYEYVALLKQYGHAAARYFEEIANDAEDRGKALHVAVSGGQPIFDMVSSFHDRIRENVTFYAAAMIGRARYTNKAPHVGSEANATIAWARSGRLPEKLIYGTVPAYDIPPAELNILNREERHAYATEEILKQKETISSNRPVHNVLEDLYNNVNVAFAGLGVPHAVGEDAKLGPGHVERLTMTGMVKILGIDSEILMKQGAVGDISYCLFDAEGHGRPEWELFITVGTGSKHSGVAYYRHLVQTGKKVIVIAGVRKEPALRAALAGKLLNVLVTDAVTAQNLLHS